MERSEQIGDLIAALAKAQGEFSAALKQNESIAFGTGNRAYKYADLAANISAVRPALSKHGIALMQFNESDLEHQTAKVTTSLHYAEQFISITAEAPAVGRNGFDVQTLGACWTYLRRYTLQAICGLASEDDDAADLAGAKNAPIQSKQPPQTQQRQEPAKQNTAPPRPPAGVFNFNNPPNLIFTPSKPSKGKSPKSGKEYVLVSFAPDSIDGRDHALCFDTKLWPAIFEAEGKECMMTLKANGNKKEGNFYITIEDVLSIGEVPYQNGIPADVSEFNQENPNGDV